MKRYVKDDDSVVDYQITWTDFLGEDTIVTSTWVSGDDLWEGSTAYKVGDRVRLDTVDGEMLEVITAGTSGVTEPTAPALGDTVTDGTVTWLRAFAVTDTSNTASTTTLVVTGGTAGQEYPVTNHITTAGDLEEDETLYFVIVPK